MIGLAHDLSPHSVFEHPAMIQPSESGVAVHKSEADDCS